MATVKEFTRLGLPPQTHAFNDPDLSAIEFLQAVYRDSSLPMSTRIDAARGLLPFTEPRPARAPSSHVGCTIVIGGLGPCDHGSSPEDPATGSTGNHSQNPISSNTTLPHDGDTQAPENLTRYSDPPSSEDIQQITKAIHALRPDLAHLPTPEFHLCPCGHWITGSYPCCEARNKNRLN